ncbi:MAG: hypothetical protein GY821_02400 [Gammaproteobacteria bacterium]|nr:hypothetical protein [Gammaproteobacteria bacterium]
MSILELQNAMLKEPQVDIETTHVFSNGVYLRGITIPEGVVIVGAEHLTDHSFIVSKGSCIINDGKEKLHIQAPYHGLTKAGTKRSIYATTDTVFTTFHITDETDIFKIEKQIIKPEGLEIQNNSGGKISWHG